MVQVKFQVQAEVNFNERVFVTGNHDSLGNWKSNNAPAMVHFIEK